MCRTDAERVRVAWMALRERIANPLLVVGDDSKWDMRAEQRGFMHREEGPGWDRGEPT